MSEEMTRDRDTDKVKTTLVTSLFSKEVLTNLKESGYFESNTKAFRFAVSYAIERDLPVPQDMKLPDSSGLTWGTTQMDPDGLLRQLIEQIYKSGEQLSQKEAYILAELLVEAATQDISRKLERGMSVGQLVTD